MKKLSIIIPVYNEAKTIQFTLDKIKDVNLLNDIEKEIIIVNDCSTDESEAVVFTYKQNNGSININ